MKINLFNRDGATMWLEKLGNNIWELKVDKAHDYCLKYIRVIGNYEAIDPSGGPFLSVGDYVDKTHKIVDILSCTILKLSEDNNN